MSEQRIDRTKLKSASVRMSGGALAILAVTLVLAPNYNEMSIRQKNVAAFLAGMFGFASVELLRR